jgi:NADH-quinone oxidoreductase subunit J
MSYPEAAQILFAIYAAIIAAGGLAAVLAKSLVRALLGLVLTLFGVSGLYLLLNAPFIALMQLLIYVGAVVVLIFFAIMLTKGTDQEREDAPQRGGQIFLALLAGAGPAGVLAWICLHAKIPTHDPIEIGLRVLGKALLDEYVLAFELISVVLFAAMAGAVLLGFERRRAK